MDGGISTITYHGRTVDRGLPEITADTLPTLPVLEQPELFSIRFAAGFIHILVAGSPSSPSLVFPHPYSEGSRDPQVLS